MLIISKKKDFYDGVAGTTGIDKTIVYDRQIIEFEKNDIPELFHKKYRWTDDKGHPFYMLGNTHTKKKYEKKYPHDAYFIVGFCGKLYIGWKFYSVNESTEEYDNVITEITYDLDYITEILEPKGWWNNNLQDNIDYIMNYNAMDSFRKLNTPCFIYDEDFGRTHVDKHIRYNSWNWSHDVPKFFINPLLKDYEFYQVFKTFEAFQEISMFIGGVLGNKEKEIINVADKYKITQHGFDKWSFRKEPENKK
jgi:hypothetical protein